MKKEGGARSFYSIRKLLLRSFRALGTLGCIWFLTQTLPTLTEQGFAAAALGCLASFVSVLVLARISNVSACYQREPKWLSWPSKFLGACAGFKLNSSGMRLETQLSTAQLTRRDRSRNKNLNQFHTIVVPQMMSRTSHD